MSAPNEYRDGFLDGWASGYLAVSGTKPWSVVEQERAEQDYARVNEKRAKAIRLSSSPAEPPASEPRADTALIRELADRLAYMDRIAGEHHSASIMREEHDVCPICTVQMFSANSVLVKRARERLASPPGGATTGADTERLDEWRAKAKERALQHEQDAARMDWLESDEGRSFTDERGGYWLTSWYQRTTLDPRDAPIPMRSVREMIDKARSSSRPAIPTSTEG